MANTSTIITVFDLVSTGSLVALWFVLRLLGVQLLQKKEFSILSI